MRNGDLSVAKWRTPFPMPYRLGLIGTDDIAGTREWEIIHESFQVWQSCPDLSVSFAYAGTTDATDVAYDGQNSVIFVDNLGEGYLAATTVTALVRVINGSTVLEIVDADLRINDSASVQFLDGPSESWNRVSLKGVVVHEIGHMLGLHHTMAREATMWWLTRVGQETLDTDDIAGMAALYPAPAQPVQTATIEGTVRIRRQDDTVEPYFGGNVLAVNCHTGKAVAADISRTWQDPGRHGRYRIQGLPPGVYAVYCEKTRSQFLSGGPLLQPGGEVSTYYASIPFPLFSPRCLGDGTSDPRAGQVVTLSAGQTLLNADIEIVEGATDVFDLPPGNDTPQYAVEIGDGSAVASFIKNSVDVDYFTFNIDRPCMVYLTVECAQSRFTDDVWEAVEEPDLYMTLYADDGETVLAQSDDHWFSDPYLYFRVRRPGRFYLKLADKSGNNVFDVDYLLCLSTTGGGPSGVPLEEWQHYD
ncbi:matrixin family metalloprotease [bacterium]|nr:matrixin family metalloprotease [bacterium]